jgi:hypothetical protein
MKKYLVQCLAQNKTVGCMSLVQLHHPASLVLSFFAFYMNIYSHIYHPLTNQQVFFEYLAYVQNLLDVGENSKGR